MSAPKTVNLKGEGGVTWTFDLPLTEVYADQVKNRKLEPADEESAEELQDLLAGESDSEEPSVASEPPAEKPPLEKMKLAELLELATSEGVDSDTVESFSKPGTTKAQVIAAITAAREKE